MEYCWKLAQRPPGLAYGVPEGELDAAAAAPPLPTASVDVCASSMDDMIRWVAQASSCPASQGSRHGASATSTGTLAAPSDTASTSAAAADAPLPLRIVTDLRNPWVIQLACAEQQLAESSLLHSQNLARALHSLSG